MRELASEPHPLDKVSVCKNTHPFTMLQTFIVLAVVLSTVRPDHKSSAMKLIIFPHAYKHFSPVFPGELSLAIQKPILKAAFIDAFAINSQSTLSVEQSFIETTLIDII